MTLPARLLPCAAILATLAGCGGQPAATPDTPTTAPAPAPVAEAPRQLAPAERRARLATWLGARYGSDAGGDTAWRDRVDGRPVHRYLCLDATTVWQGTEHSVLAICSNRDDASEHEPGLVDVLLLRPDAAGGLAVSAERLNHPAGLGGVATAPTLVQLGPDTPALLLQTPVADAHAARTDAQLLAADGSALRPVARFVLQLDNQQQLTCETETAHNAEAEAVASDSPWDSLAAAPAEVPAANCDADLLQLATTWQADSQASGPWWPLQLEQTGVACGSAVALRQQLDYDPSQRRYGAARLTERCP